MKNNHKEFLQKVGFTEEQSDYLMTISYLINIFDITHLEAKDMIKRGLNGNKENLDLESLLRLGVIVEV